MERLDICPTSFFKKEADPIRKRLQQKNLSVWKGFYIIIRNYNRHPA